MKVVINSCYGGFDVSDEVLAVMNVESSYDILREDPRFVSLVEELGEKASTTYSRLKVVEIPDDITDWEISDYDGCEQVIYVLDGKIRRAW